MKFTIIIPAYNEEENIRDVITAIGNSLEPHFEIIVVDDYSTDKTAGIVTELEQRYHHLRLVRNTSRKGFASAMKTGFDSAHTDIIVPVMADSCDDLTLIPAMLRKIDAGYDVVSASRYIKGGARIGGPRVKGLLSRAGGISLHYLTGVPTTDISNSFKMYRKKVIDAIQVSSKSFEISMEMLLKSYRLGFTIAEVPTLWKERTRGKSNFQVFKLAPRFFKLYLWALFMRRKGSLCHYFQ